MALTVNVINSENILLYYYTFGKVEDNDVCCVSCVFQPSSLNIRLCIEVSNIKTDFYDSGKWNVLYP